MNNVVRQRLKLAAIVSAAVAGAAVVFLFEPAQCSFYPRCPFHALTGLDCPGCGSTRALHQLVHGHLDAAFRLNPLAVALLPVVALAAWRREQFVRPAWIWTLLAVIIGFGILRNVPWLTP